RLLRALQRHHDAGQYVDLGGSPDQPGPARTGSQNHTGRLPALLLGLALGLLPRDSPSSGAQRICADDAEPKLGCLRRDPRRQSCHWFYPASLVSVSLWLRLAAHAGDQLAGVSPVLGAYPGAVLDHRRRAHLGPADADTDLRGRRLRGFANYLRIS